MTVPPPDKYRPRSGQVEFERGTELHRISGLLARRQYGKTTIASRISLKKMMRTANHTVIFGSVKLDLGREIVRKESAEIQRAFRMMAVQAAAAKLKLDCVDGTKGTEVFDLAADDWAELYEAQRLEFRLYHSRTVYSRTKVVALTPDAVGETGDLILDEVGRGKKFREVLEAVMPIISSNPAFRCVYTTTPPPDDTHPSFELLAPPIGTELPVNPKGNWYKSELGVWVLRVTAADAYADGVPLYDDDTGAAISPEESRRRSHDKDAWDRNYGCQFVLGGTAAVGLLQLDTAQRRGIGRCTCILVESEADLDRGLALLAARVGSGPVGIGADWATTENETSNPTAVTVMEEQGVERIGWVTFIWKTRDPDLAIERLRRVVVAVNSRPKGGRARRLCQDATNERYHCANVRKELGSLVPVEDVVASETIELPGQEPVTKKQHLGNLWIGEIDDNHVTLPPERYIKDDFRLVRRDRGSFTAEVSQTGQHGDTFDSHKLANWALNSSSGAINDSNVQLLRTGVVRMARRPVFVPHRLS